MTTLDKFFKGDTTALSRVISFVENQRDDYHKLLARLYPRSGKAYKVGFTGPPGSGKSTLVDKLASKLSMQKNKVGIIAVDPTSPFTGGALLGDRIRMQNLILCQDVYVRSMATRGSFGGLATTTKEVALVLDAFGKDFIIIETVGVGQVELDVANTCDTTVVVFVPESGDSIQAMKAGLMEIADIFVVNKTDREGANRIITELESILDLKREKEKWDYPVVATQAINDVGIEELLSKVVAHQIFLSENGILQQKRKEQVKAELKEIIESRIKKVLEKRVFSNLNLDKIAENVLKGEDDPYSAGERFLDEADLF
ncbi:MAG: methylmalonyl Co-A mutase-associated GTPase MeaB [Candidatus Zixiibacteriota bacterium]